jgi:ABC-type nitrate/sulfonate/bicarbonate transport system ATPase subunit
MTPKITVLGVHKTFHTRGGPVPVLERVSFDIADGEFVAVIGPSGCGKSTLLGVVAGFVTPDEGDVAIDGEPVQQPRRRAMYIFQQPALFPWLDLRHNVMLGLDGAPRDVREREAARYIELAGLTGFERAFPHQLSGGMQQRAELARALIVKPEILLMDEPFAALDALTRLRIRVEFLRILERERHTVLFVTHDVDEALQLADRILVLSSRPAHIRAEIEIPDPRPRSLMSPRLLALKHVVLRELGVIDLLAGTT